MFPNKTKTILLKEIVKSSLPPPKGSKGFVITTEDVLSSLGGMEPGFENVPLLPVDFQSSSYLGSQLLSSPFPETLLDEV